MSADPNALLAFKQLNLKERVRVHGSLGFRRASTPAKNANSFFPPPAPSSCDPCADRRRASADGHSPPDHPPFPTITARGVPRGDRARREGGRGAEAPAGGVRGARARARHRRGDGTERAAGARRDPRRAGHRRRGRDEPKRRARRARGGPLPAQARARRGRRRSRRGEEARKEEREGADAGAAKRRGDKPPAADAASASDSDDEDGAARDVGGLDEDATRAVDALRARARAASVKSTLAKVLDAVDAANARQTGAAGDDPSARPRARARVAALDARATADAEQLERFREQTTKQRKRNEELGKKLEDSTADVEMLRRQLRMARSDAGQIEGLPPMATAHSAKAAAAVAVSAAAGGGKDAAGKDASGAAGAGGRGGSRGRARRRRRRRRRRGRRGSFEAPGPRV